MLRLLIPLVAVVVVIGVLLSAFTVNESEQVIITQFGKPVGNAITEPGLHFRIPFVQEVRRFDKRILQWDGAAEQIVTKDKRFIFLDTMARWRIVDPLEFLQTVQDERGAQTRLDDIIDAGVRNAVSGKPLIEVVRSSNREMVQDLQDVGDQEQAEIGTVLAGRDQIARDITAAAAPETRKWGIELLDVRVKRVIYVDSVLREIYARMISERQRIAARERAEGKAERAKILGRLERDLSEVTSEAFRKAEQIRGEADATAARTYSEAYSQDPEFYEFLRTLETYRKALASDDVTLVLSSESDLFQYLKEGFSAN